MDTSNGITAYESDSMSHRLVVETSLIHACNTIKGNKSTTSTRDIDLLAPMILQGASLNWKDIAKTQPNTFRLNAIPRRHLKLFKHNSNVSGPFPVPVSQTIEHPQVSRHSYNLRSQGFLGTSSVGNQVTFESSLNIPQSGIIVLLASVNLPLLFPAVLKNGLSMKPICQLQF